jgi:hypothetical protein
MAVLMVSAYADLHPFSDPLTWATKRNLTELLLTSMEDEISLCPEGGGGHIAAAAAVVLNRGHVTHYCTT